MDYKLKDKIALVTGSASGIGYAIALGLAKEGAKVFINGRSQEKLEQATKNIEAEAPGAKVEGIAADFSKVEEVNRLIKALTEVDILVNNVGVYGDQPFEITDDARWMLDYEINVMSGVRLSRHYLSSMKANNW